MYRKIYSHANSIRVLMMMMVYQVVCSIDSIDSNIWLQVIRTHPLKNPFIP